MRSCPRLEGSDSEPTDIRENIPDRGTRRVKILRRECAHLGAARWPVGQEYGEEVGGGEAGRDGPYLVGPGGTCGEDGEDWGQ